jgi:hypothetical protein
MSHRTLLVVVVFLSIFTYDLFRPTDIDFWWHLRTGQLIAESGAVPRTDPFSFTADGRPWVAHEWLWELGVFHLYRLGGYRAAVLLSAIIVTLAYAILYRLLRYLGANEIVAAGLVLWAAFLGVPNLGTRPREFSFLFFAFFLDCLYRYRRGESAHLWLLPLVMPLWANLHGGFVFGLGLLGLFALSETVAWLAGRGPAPRQLWVVTVLAILATGVHPLGPRVLLYPLDYYRGAQNPSFQSVTEFASPNFHAPLNLVFAAGLVTLMLLPGTRGPGSGTDALLVTVFTLQALVSMRQVIFCALVLPPVLVRRAVDRFQFVRALAPPRLPRIVSQLNLVVLGVLLLGAGAAASRQPHLQLGTEPRPGDMPVAGARFIQEQHLPDPVFNFQPWGGYLIHEWYPERRVFIDGRMDMYGKAIVNDYLNAAAAKPEWAEIFGRWGIQTVLLPKDSPLAAVLRADPHWQRLFTGDIEEVFGRAEGARPGDGGRS